MSAPGPMPRIWDLRRGDHDDDRTSPYAGGFTGLVLSAAFEFNFLKALIVFLALIVIPALLVGIALALLVTYGRLFRDAMASAGRSPAPALITLAVLIGLAIVVGRPFLRVGLDSFRQLQYTLVFPIFVALRESLRMVAERLHGRSITLKELNRGRRIGAVAAALVFAAAGLALAWTMWSTYGLQLLTPGHVHPWPLAKSALVNAAIVFGISTIVDSLYWLRQELTVGSPIMNWTPSQQVAVERREGVPDAPGFGAVGQRDGVPAAPGFGAAGSSQVVRIAHLSDLHLVGERYGFRMEAGTHGPRGNRCIVRTLRKLKDLDAGAPLDRVIVTGDITDAGTRAEWAEFLDLLRGCPGLREKISFVPGNHDTNVVDRTNVGRLDLPWSASQSLRKLRTILALDAIQGERSYVVDRSTGRLGQSLSEYLREGQRADRLRKLAGQGSLRGRWELEKVWDAIFPLVELPQKANTRLSGDSGQLPQPANTARSGGPNELQRANTGLSDHREYGVILLDSNARTHLSLTNAIGFISPPQLRALKSVLKNDPGRSWIVALHHQVVEYPVATVSLRDRIGLALVNASDFLAAIRPYARQIAVLHGHRHTDWIGSYGETVLCSAPSAALGAQPDPEHRGCFRLHSLSFDDDGGISLVNSERIYVDLRSQVEAQAEARQDDLAA